MPWAGRQAVQAVLSFCPPSPGTSCTSSHGEGPECRTGKKEAVHHILPITQKFSIATDVASRIDNWPQQNYAWLSELLSQSTHKMSRNMFSHASILCRAYSEWAQVFHVARPHHFFFFFFSIRLRNAKESTSILKFRLVHVKPCIFLDSNHTHCEKTYQKFLLLISCSLFFTQWYFFQMKHFFLGHVIYKKKWKKSRLWQREKKYSANYRSSGCVKIPPCLKSRLQVFLLVSHICNSRYDLKSLGCLLSWINNLSFALSEETWLWSRYWCLSL